MYFYLKSLHIIFIVTWFAALFYIVRLFVYQTEAQARTLEAERLLLTKELQRISCRLWQIIGWPSAVLALAFGLGMVLMRPVLLYQGWMQWKLGLVAWLILYHAYCQRLFSGLQRGIYRHSSSQLRLINEVPTLLLFPIVFLAVLKQSTGLFAGIFFLLLFVLLLYAGFRLYRGLRGLRKK